MLADQTGEMFRLPVGARSNHIDSATRYLDRVDQLRSE